MATITLAQICNGIESALSAATTLARSQSYDELTEGVHDIPTLQVYPESGLQDAGGNTDRTTFGAGVRQTEFTIHADYYAAQQSNIGEDMAALVNGIDAIQNELEKQDSTRFGFSDHNLSFRWSWTRVQFVYNEANYMGARFIIVVRVF
jgi:hypothetical protein